VDAEDAKKQYPLQVMEDISRAIIAQGKALSPRVDLGGGYYYYKVSNHPFAHPGTEAIAGKPLLGLEDSGDALAKGSLPDAPSDRDAYSVTWPCPAAPGEIDWAWIAAAERNIWGSPREHNRDYECQAVLPGADARVAAAEDHVTWRGKLYVALSLIIALAVCVCLAAEVLAYLSGR